MKDEAESASLPASTGIDRLLGIMAALRTPGSGCPWDLQQDFASIAPYTIEEAYEVADAIARGDLDDLRDELGDLLLQVVYHARMAEEVGAFAFADVAKAISDKMVKRHPHVFGHLIGADQAMVEANWRRIKAEERAKRRSDDRPAGALTGVALALPALTRAAKIQERAREVGFDWPEIAQVFLKVREEVEEVAAEIDADSDRAEEEIGDLLFAVVNLARHLNIDAERALKGATQKFERRFAALEERLAAKGHMPATSTLAEMEEAWDAVKQAEHASEKR